ncbi:MAG TPA: hypothetical protein VF735_08815 [Pyrinomonadaceae bacterium]
MSRRKRERRKMTARQVKGFRLNSVSCAVELYGEESATAKGMALVNTVLMSGRRDRRAHALMELIYLLSTRKERGERAQMVFYCLFQAGLFLDRWRTFSSRVAGYMKTRDKRVLHVK